MFKVFLSLAVFFVSFLTPYDIMASQAGKLTSINVKRSAAGVSIDLVFERPFAAKSLKPALERNFVQFALKQTRMDAARMIAVADSGVQKIFAYPYTLDTARVRVILKDDNKWAKGRVSVWNNNPKSVRIFIKDPETAAVAMIQKPGTPAEPAKAPAKTSQSPSKTPRPVMSGTAAAALAPSDSAPVAEEKTLLKEVTNNTRDIDINNPDSVKAALGRPSGIDKSGDKPGDKSADKAGDRSADRLGEKTPLVSNEEKTGPVGITADPTRHFARMAIALFGVLGLFLGCVFVVKKYASKLKKLPFGKKERVIQVVATHYLGNKKSISLVKITGEYMVVGCSNDGISLLSKLGPEVNVDKYLEDRFWGGTFEKHLDTYSKDSKSAKEIDLSSYDGVRDLGPPQSTVETLTRKIEDKVELSPLRASIKEKLTKLKPLA